MRFRRFNPIPILSIGAVILLAVIGGHAAQSQNTMLRAAYPTLDDFWHGRADWFLDIHDTGLPIGESDTVYRGNGEYWSYVHASGQSAGIVDSCGDPVPFPGCVTRWVSTTYGEHFTPASNECLLKCRTCPCTHHDQVAQQQYPRVAIDERGRWFMVYEHGAATSITTSQDGINWGTPARIWGTGIWKPGTYPYNGIRLDLMEIGPHPSFTPPYKYMAGGPPGIFIDGAALYVFVGLGQNPGHMGCFKSSIYNIYGFSPCRTQPLFSGAGEYGPVHAQGLDANPYFDFRFVTSADVIKENGVYYMAYEGIRGPSHQDAGRDDQFGLGFARSWAVDGTWEKYPGNPTISGLVDNWGIGHADIVFAESRYYLYAGQPGNVRSRYVLAWR